MLKSVLEAVNQKVAFTALEERIRDCFLTGRSSRNLQWTFFINRWVVHDDITVLWYIFFGSHSLLWHDYNHPSSHRHLRSNRICSFLYTLSLLTVRFVKKNNLFLSTREAYVFFLSDINTVVLKLTIQIICSCSYFANPHSSHISSHISLFCHQINFHEAIFVTKLLSWRNIWSFQKVATVCVIYFVGKYFFSISTFFFPPVCMLCFSHILIITLFWVWIVLSFHIFQALEVMLPHWISAWVVAVHASLLLVLNFCFKLKNKSQLKRGVCFLKKIDLQPVSNYKFCFSFNSLSMTHWNVSFTSSYFQHNRTFCHQSHWLFSQQGKM